VDVIDYTANISRKGFVTAVRVIVIMKCMNSELGPKATADLDRKAA